MTNIKVCKFGGTSLKDGKSLKIVKQIILSDSSRKLIVVSAPGKRFKGDSKVTDLLIMASKNKYNNQYFWVNKVKERFLEIANAIGVQLDFEDCFTHLKDEDYLVSRGEYLMAKIMAKYLNYDFLDPFDYIYLTKNFNVSLKSQKKLEAIDFKKGVVMAGFYGQGQNGKVKLFDRGGSDITGSILARYINAKIYENWSDVNGIMCANPKVILNPKYINFLTYKDFKNLDVLNPQVLHKYAYKPVIGTKTVINIRNTFNKSCHGTFILNKLSNKAQVLSVANIGDLIKITGRMLKSINCFKTTVYKTVNINRLIRFTNTEMIFTVQNGCGDEAVKKLYCRIFK